MTQDELQHYGVLGMKWGVRKNPDTAYVKAGDKLKKLDAKAEKKTARAQKALEKTWRKTNRAQRAILFKGVKKWSAAGQSNRAIKAYASAKSAESKAMRWQKAMDKTFNNVKVNSIDRETERLGKKYAEKTVNDLAASNTSMNSLYEMYERNKTRFNR